MITGRLCDITDLLNSSLLERSSFLAIQWTSLIIFVHCSGLLKEGALVHLCRLFDSTTVRNDQLLFVFVVFITVHTSVIISLERWHCPHSMQSRVYETGECPSVLLTVCPIIRQQERRVCCWAPRGQEISIDSGHPASTAQQHSVQHENAGVSYWQARDELNIDLYLFRCLCGRDDASNTSRCHRHCSDCWAGQTGSGSCSESTQRERRFFAERDGDVQVRLSHDQAARRRRLVGAPAAFVRPSHKAVPATAGPPRHRGARRPADLPHGARSTPRPSRACRCRRRCLPGEPASRVRDDDRLSHLPDADTLRRVVLGRVFSSRGWVYISSHQGRPLSQLTWPRFHREDVSRM